MSSPPYVQGGYTAVGDPVDPYQVANKRYVDQLAVSLPSHIWSQWQYISTSTSTSRIHLASHFWLSQMFSTGTTQTAPSPELDFSFDIDSVGWTWSGNTQGNKLLQLRIHDSSEDNDPLFTNTLAADTWRNETGLTFPKELEKDHKYWIGVTAPTGVNTTVYTITVLWKVSNFNFD